MKGYIAKKGKQYYTAIYEALDLARIPRQSRAPRPPHTEQDADPTPQSRPPHQPLRRQAPPG
ncbi:MAG: hypothetical protein GXP35_07430 [Actinobacteria bacterium]|nr:hypothetical protein [Actinomycetota bacterium]